MSLWEAIHQLIGLLGLGEAAKEHRARIRLLNRLESEVGRNLERLHEAIPLVEHIERRSRELKSWRVGLAPFCTEYWTDVYQQEQGNLGLLSPKANDLLTHFYDALEEAKSYRDKLTFQSDDVRKMVNQYVDQGSTEEEARNMLYPGLLLDLRSVLKRARAKGEELRPILSKERRLFAPWQRLKERLHQSRTNQG